MKMIVQSCVTRRAFACILGQLRVGDGDSSVLFFGIPGHFKHYFYHDISMGSLDYGVCVRCIKNTSFFQPAVRILDSQSAAHNALARLTKLLILKCSFQK
jgi:hypothetical protein